MATQFEGMNFSGDLNPENVRKIDALFARGQDQAEAMEAEKRALAEEKRLYQSLINGPESGSGWKPHEQPLHRVEEINKPTAAIIRTQCAAYPLTSRLRKYGEAGGREIEWYETRPVTALPEEELFSDMRYVKLYEQAVSRGEASPLTVTPAPDDQPPTNGERYLLYAEVEAAWKTCTDRRLVSDLAGMMTALSNWSLGLWETMELAFMHETDGLTILARVQRMTEAVPALVRVLWWLEAREAA